MLRPVSGAMIWGMEDALFRTLGYKHLAHFMTLGYALVIHAPAEECNEPHNECGLSREKISPSPT
jgi:hypothetical protein